MNQPALLKNMSISEQASFMVSSQGNQSKKFLQEWNYYIGLLSQISLIL